MSQERAMDVTPYVAAAQQRVLAVLECVPITSAILDDWNADKRMVGPRIIYGAPFVRGCRSRCARCPLFLAVGDREEPNDTPLLRHTLCKARPEQLTILPSKQKYLNCKTTREYGAAFVRWILECCPDNASLIAELDWVAGFRLIYNRSFNAKLLAMRERQIKQLIYRTAIDGLRKRNDRTRETAVRTYFDAWRAMPSAQPERQVRR